MQVLALLHLGLIERCFKTGLQKYIMGHMGRLCRMDISLRGGSTSGGLQVELEG